MYCVFERMLEDGVRYLCFGLFVFEYFVGCRVLRYKFKFFFGIMRGYYSVV